MNSKDDTIQLINFEAKRAPEDSDANIALTWEVANAAQVTIEGPGVGVTGLNRCTVYGGSGELHINTNETQASYKLTAAPDPLRLINGQCEVDLNGKSDTESSASGASTGSNSAGADSGITKLGLKGVDVKDGRCYVPYNSKQTLEWAYENAKEASFEVVKGEVANVPEGNVPAKGDALIGPFTSEKGAVIKLELGKPNPASETLSIRIQRAQISVTNAQVKAGDKATLSWEVKSAESIAIIPFKGTNVAAPSNPEVSGSMSFEVESGQTYEFKVEATSFDDKKSHKVMSATVV